MKFDAIEQEAQRIASYYSGHPTTQQHLAEDIAKALREAIRQAWAECAGMIREAKKHYENEDITLTMHVALDCLAAKIDAKAPH